jgi:hypothetical protein
LTPQLYHISPPIQPTHSYHRPFRAGLFVLIAQSTPPMLNLQKMLTNSRKWKPECSPASIFMMKWPWTDSPKQSGMAMHLLSLMVLYSMIKPPTQSSSSLTLTMKTLPLLHMQEANSLPLPIHWHGLSLTKGCSPFHSIDPNMHTPKRICASRSK